MALRQNAVWSISVFWCPSSQTPSRTNIISRGQRTIAGCENSAFRASFDIQAVVSTETVRDSVFTAKLSVFLPCCFVVAMGAAFRCLSSNHHLNRPTKISCTNRSLQSISLCSIAGAPSFALQKPICQFHRQIFLKPAFIRDHCWWLRRISYDDGRVCRRWLPLQWSLCWDKLPSLLNMYVAFVMKSIFYISTCTSFIVRFYIFETLE